MIIDERQLENGITAEILAALIRKHEGHIPRLEHLRAYYIGRHIILDRRRSSKTAANNRVVCNHAKYIVDITTAFLVGNAIKYEAAAECDIEAVKNEFYEQNIGNIDSEIVKNASIYGNAFELVYANEEAKPRSASISPMNAFVVYNDSCEHEPILGVYYYKKYDINGNVTGLVCNAYDKMYNYTFEAETNSWEMMVQTSRTAHYFGKVPLIEHINNEERMGDFENVISLIDAYNELQSDRVNDKEDFVDAFLFLRGLDLDSEVAEKLKEERILLGYEGSDAKYLSKTMTESDIKVLRDDLKEDIHRFSMVPDLSDDSFGSNLSGVAIRYKILGFEQLAKSKESHLRPSIERRFELYNKYLTIKGAMEVVPKHKIDVIFTHNLPSNNLETAQMISYLRDDLSLATKLAQFDFITDAEEEAQLVVSERKKAMEESAIYTKPISVDVNEEEE